MCETNFMSRMCVDCGSLAMVAIIVTALATMVGLVKPADTLKYCGVILGIVIVFVLIVSVLVGLWSGMSCGNGSSWQRLVFASGGCGRSGIRHGRKRKRNKAPGGNPGRTQFKGGIMNGLS